MISSMAITADNRYLFTGDIEDGDVKQFRVSDGRMIKHYHQLLEDGISSLITTHDSKYLFAGGKRGQLKQICLESQELVHDYGKIYNSDIYQLQTTRDSKYVISGGGKRVTRISIKNRDVEEEFGRVCYSKIWAMKISADQEKLFLGDMNGYLKLVSLTDGTTIKDFEKIHDCFITAIVITADEKFLFTSS